MSTTTRPHAATSEEKVLVARKPCFMLLYIRMAQVPFDIDIDTSFPDAGELP
jgi:metaxin